MSCYLDKQIDWFESIEADIRACASDRHKTILRNYMLHAAYELVGQTEALFGETLMVEEPVYVISGLGEPERREYRGRDNVKARFGFVRPMWQTALSDQCGSERITMISDANDPRIQSQTCQSFPLLQLIA